MVNRRALLWGFVGLFVVVIALMIWNSFFTSRAFFQAGTKPPQVTEKTSPATLPPLRATDPSTGTSSTQSVTIVEFSDFACVYCRMNEANLRTIMKDYSDRVHLIWRDFPVHTDTPESVLAAVAGRCAAEQGKFWEMQRALFDSNSLSFDRLKSIGHSVVADSGRFDTCLTETKPMAAIQSDIELAKKYHITSVPTLFINGVAYEGLLSDAELRAAIRKGLLLSR